MASSQIGQATLRNMYSFLQAFCFVSSFSGDLIAPEAVMKLRQKNPLTVRIADEDRGEVVQDSNLLLSPSPIRLASVSSHLASFCKCVASCYFRLTPLFLSKHDFRSSFQRITRQDLLIRARALQHPRLNGRPRCVVHQPHSGHRLRQTAALLCSR